MNLSYYWISIMFKINRKHFFMKWRVNTFFHNISSTVPKSVYRTIQMISKWKHFYRIKRQLGTTLKISSCKYVFSKSVYHWYCDSWKTLFYTTLSLPRGLLQPPFGCVLWNKCFKRSPHFMSVISAITLQRCW